MRNQAINYKSTKPNISTNINVVPPFQNMSQVLTKFSQTTFQPGDESDQIEQNSINKSCGTQTDSELNEPKQVHSLEVVVVGLMQQIHFLKQSSELLPIVILTNFSNIINSSNTHWKDDLFLLLFHANINLSWIIDCKQDVDTNNVYITAVNNVMQNKIKYLLLHYFKKTFISATG